MSRKLRGKIVLACALGFGIAGQGAESEKCSYNSFHGTLTHHFVAHEQKKSRSWVPVELRLCENDKGVYAIIAHQAVSLGILANPPLKATTYSALKPGDEKVAILINNLENDRDALRALDDKDVEAVVLGGTSATQVTVFRKQLNRVVSNTLFGGKVDERAE